MLKLGIDSQPDLQPSGLADVQERMFLKLGSPRTPRWREMDSNFRFRARRNQEISVSRWSSTDLVYGTVARISAEPSGRHAREQYRADKCPVDGEGLSREALEDAQKAPDRDKGREAADNQADDEHQPAMRIEA